MALEIAPGCLALGDPGFRGGQARIDLVGSRLPHLGLRLEHLRLRRENLKLCLQHLESCLSLDPGSVDRCPLRGGGGEFLPVMVACLGEFSGALGGIAESGFELQGLRLGGLARPVTLRDRGGEPLF